MNTQVLKSIVTILFCAALIPGVIACGGAAASGPRAWIDVPLDGSSVPAGAPIPVLAHVYAPDGVAEVLFSVNGVPYRRSAPAQPDATLNKISQQWIAQQEGDYILQVIAYSKSGKESNPATARVRAIGKPTPIPPLEPGKPTPIPPSQIQPTPVPTLPQVIPATAISPTAVGASDLALVSVEAMFVGYKGTIALCKPRVVYRNNGTVPVPNDYQILLSVNGVPQMSVTRGAGFGVGGTSEAILDYTFEGMPYIGVNLDSTNAVSESDELNNAFAEIRLCSGPAAPVTATVTPTTLPTPTTPPTRTPTATTPPPAGCSGTPNIASFSASPATILVGNSATLSWGAVTNADYVSIEPGIGGVGTPGSATVSPTTTTTYTLTARCGGNTQTRQTTITVTSPPKPTRTPTTPPDTTAPPAPSLISPSGALACRANVTLRWNAVSDPSGIQTYYIKLERQISKGNWQSVGGWTTSETSQSVGVQCGGIYRWQARAQDKAGNTGPWSGAMNFGINLP